MAGSFTLATAILLLLAISSSTACNKLDQKALLAFKSAFPSTPFSTWTTSTDCCSWENVGCNRTTGRVTSLSFSGNQVDNPTVGLNGSIPASIGDFSALETLTLSSLYSLVGPIPPQLSKLKSLKTLIVYSTNLSGPVPSFLSSLTALEQLTLGNSKFVGAIPSSLGSLPNLNSINLSGNKLSGSIPPSLFSKISKDMLPSFDVGNNKLTGEIPRSFGDVGFYSIDLHDNQLTGDASFLFGKSKPLSQITLAQNKLSFDLSPVEYPTVNPLNVDLSHNQIYGSISNQIIEVDVRLINVSYNKLCGKIPSGGNFGPFGAYLFEHNKCLCGTPLPACK
ncbi:polygalacturonase inhibitor-like [Iris pallida]|uniref:Polygalacturonase inhibitor-like n=1 Tax=Iris pallida TaxID=29817 RepID=A0AAX6ID77_IRIPA|nr:polygalacturonase inhibitor-like [Iris pallida]